MRVGTDYRRPSTLCPAVSAAYPDISHGSIGNSIPVQDEIMQWVTEGGAAATFPQPPPPLPPPSSPPPPPPKGTCGPGTTFDASAGQCEIECAPDELGLADPPGRLLFESDKAFALNVKGAPAVAQTLMHGDDVSLDQLSGPAALAVAAHLLQTSSAATHVQKGLLKHIVDQLFWRPALGSGD